MSNQLLEKPIPADTDAKIANTLIKCQNNTLTPITIKAIEYSLRHLAQHANLIDPEEVKHQIATATNTKTGKPVANETKNRLCYAYDKFCEYNQIKWEKPYYKCGEKAPLIPSKDNVTAIVSNASKRYTVIFNILAEIGCSPSELSNITQKDINTQTGEITITGTKGHASKAYKLKTPTAEMLRQYIARYPEEHPFPHSKSIRQVWIDTKQRTAKKLCNPELLKIPCRSLRNYSGAQYYLKLPVRDPIAVMRHLRHKKLETTMHYLQAIILDEDEEYEIRVVDSTDIEGIKKLGENGFTKYDEADGKHFYRKHK